MNDEFEAQLQRQALQPIPPEWRSRILNRAAAQAPIVVRVNAEAVLPWWRALLWPSPRAWVGMAALWVALFIMNREAQPGLRSTITVKNVAPPRELRMAMAEKHRFFAELMNEMDPAIEPEKQFIPKPRTEARAAIARV